MITLKKGISRIAVMLILLLGSACSTPNNNTIPMFPAEPAAPIKNSALHITVSDYQQSDNLVNDPNSKLHFKYVIPWLHASLAQLNNTGCKLNHPIALHVSLSKLYTNTDSENIVGTLVLKTKYLVQGKPPITEYYRGECVGSFFSLTETEVLQTCFNSAIQQIIPKMKQDICQKQIG